MDVEGVLRVASEDHFQTGAVLDAYRRHHDLALLVEVQSRVKFGRRRVVSRLIELTVVDCALKLARTLIGRVVPAQQFAPLIRLKVYRSEV